MTSGQAENSTPGRKIPKCEPNQEPKTYKEHKSPTRHTQNTRIQKALRFNLQYSPHPCIQEAEKTLIENKIVILVVGLGNPLFTTDSTASVRAVELNSDIMLKATTVDGIYSDDPKINKKAIKYDFLTVDEAITKNLKVMDQTSLCFCRDNNLDVRVFNADSQGAILEAISNENTKIGTLVRLKND